jgi:AraC-like DNA-binding protein
MSHGLSEGVCSAGSCDEHMGVAFRLGVSVVSCGLFISNGQGTHPDRVLDNYELIVVRKGMLSIWEEDVRYDVPPEHALLLAAGKRHRGAAPFERDLSFYWIHFVVEPVARSKHSSKQSDTINIPKLTRVQRFDCVAELFHRYLDDQEARRLTPLYSAALLVQILSEVSRSPLESPTTHRAALVGRAEAHITQHMPEPLSTARIARALKTNPDYLNRAFREVHHMTMTEYIHRRRLTDACAMLRDTTDTIAEIATACGYLSIGHFRRMFVRYRGVSPTAYRRLMARAYVNAR